MPNRATTEILIDTEEIFRNFNIPHLPTIKQDGELLLTNHINSDRIVFLQRPSQVRFNRWKWSN
jgi:hypothetical protein